jgi:hypothetical protein
MSIDNIPSNYNGLGYGDYTNPTQTYIDYSVNEINGPSNVQTFTITDGEPILPNGSTKYVVYIVKDNDITVDFSSGFETSLEENGFNKTGQVMILTNSYESNANITINNTIRGEGGSVYLEPGDTRYLFLILAQDGILEVYAIGANPEQDATIQGNNNLVYGNNAYLAGLTGASNYNIAFGANALASNTGGSNNIAIGGTGTLSASTTGSFNVCIGSGANVNAGTISNSIIIGSNALSTANGQFVLGSSTNQINTSTTGTGPPLGGGVAKNFLQIILNGTLGYIPVYSALT